ncbi:MAG: murein L,D-transpeptidase catalytic domain-containing protein [Sandaracinobacteroides sp.]
MTRRALLGAGLAWAAAPAAAQSVVGHLQFARPTHPGGPRSLESVVFEGLGRHGRKLANRDLVGIADFAAPSRSLRFYLVDVVGGRATRHLVSHGRGSDPAHSGWVERFSNEPGSLASSAGGYRTADHYTGRHGASQRLLGLEPQNSNAEPRAIVIHGAWYVSADMVRQHGKLGRSEGCFAFDEAGSLGEILARLGPGRLLYAGRFGIA